MEEQLLQVFGSASNSAIVRPPGREFPGVVIQGDTLSILARNAAQLAAWVASQKLVPNEVLSIAQDLVTGLVGRALHYQKVLAAHDVELPYSEPLSGRDLIEIPLRSPSLNLVVLRCQDLLLSKRFYSELGLSFTEERHGNGPDHFSAVLGDVVFELYPGRSASTAGLRLGLELGCDVAAIRRALSIGGALLEPAALTEHTRRLVVRDPDGHSLQLVLGIS